ncbi:MAG TPA: NAD-dependent epimerase/dehydratase family protein, partial [Nitrospina sp.]|nr:NAD-dependent epimerase/dehydratase family protein [Nitrospina sp.]
MKKKAFITGISGQDGSYLAEHLLEQNYEVYGMIRRHSVAESQETRIDHLVSSGSINTDYGDLLDAPSLYKLLASVRPDEIYNLGAMSHVRVSFDIPHFTLQT